MHVRAVAGTLVVTVSSLVCLLQCWARRYDSARAFCNEGLQFAIHPSAFVLPNGQPAEPDCGRTPPNLQAGQGCSPS